MAKTYPNVSSSRLRACLRSASASASASAFGSSSSLPSQLVTACDASSVHVKLFHRLLYLPHQEMTTVIFTLLCAGMSSPLTSTLPSGSPATINSNYMSNCTGAKIHRALPSFPPPPELLALIWNASAQPDGRPISSFGPSPRLQPLFKSRSEVERDDTP
ncbi:hypothetical protein CCHR01_18486 [Colletotrichum chrysophilum]|uniref:Uncharacterized protein n=1 Tax=Colletotrichum chrysophilum TaxID=1836956 RepID=A0AAD9A0A5_9PEZI|nr:hypothetical protein CCHR01_18486 [Colletotrichum chrysophilum]